MRKATTHRTPFASTILTTAKRPPQQTTIPRSGVVQHINGNAFLIFETGGQNASGPRATERDASPLYWSLTDCYSM